MRLVRYAGLRVRQVLKTQRLGFEIRRKAYFGSYKIKGRGLDFLSLGRLGRYNNNFR